MEPDIVHSLIHASMYAELMHIVGLLHFYVAFVFEAVSGEVPSFFLLAVFVVGCEDVYGLLEPHELLGQLVHHHPEAPH